MQSEAVLRGAVIARSVPHTLLGRWVTDTRLKLSGIPVRLVDMNDRLWNPLRDLGISPRSAGSLVEPGLAVRSKHRHGRRSNV